MKLLVLALCVCAASAASYNFGSSTPKPWQGKYQPQSTTYQYFKSTAAPKPTYPTYAKVSPTFAAPQPTYPTYAKVSPTFVPTFAPTYAPTFAPTTYKPAIVEPVQEYQPARAAFKPVYKEPTPLVSEPARSYNKPSYTKESEAEELAKEFKIKPEGFYYNYQTGNGISSSATGTLKTADNVNFLTVEGKYEYPGPNGAYIVVEYTADENGFRPRSDILPVGPQTPDYVVRQVEYLRLHAPPVENKYYN